MNEPELQLGMASPDLIIFPGLFLFQDFNCEQCHRKMNESDYIWVRGIHAIFLLSTKN